MLAFFQDPGAPNATKTDAKDWARVLKELDELRAVNVDLAGDGGRDAGAGAPRAPEARAGVGAPASQ
jgi:hypothetical protein